MSSTKSFSMVLYTVVSFPDPTNPSADHFQYHAQGGGSGDSCHFSMFTAGIHMEPIVLQI